MKLWFLPYLFGTRYLVNRNKQILNLLRSLQIKNFSSFIQLILSVYILVKESFCYIEVMSPCQQARGLLSHLKTLQEQLQASQISSIEYGVWQKEGRSTEDIADILATKHQILSTIEQLKSILYVTEQEAEQILGEKKLFLGSEAVNGLFEVKLEPTDIPPIPFSKKELEKAAELGSVLILVINKDQAGNPLTAKRIAEITEEKLKTIDPELPKLFYDTTWYQDEPFYTTNTPLATLQKNPITAKKEKTVQAQWILISKETLPHSKNKNFLEQTFLLAEHLKNNILPQIKNKQRRQPYLAALAELEAKRAELAAKSKLLNSDAWKQLTNEQKKSLTQLLTNLKINQLTRPDFATMVYLQAMYLKVYHQYLLTDDHTRVNETSTISSSCRLVSIVNSVRDGIHVARWNPYARFSFLGASFLSSL